MSVQPKIILYEDENFGGRSVEITEPLAKLSEVLFDDVISSIIVESGSWIVYDDANFKGSSYELTPGKYPNPSSWGGKDDELSSIKPVTE